MSKRTVKINYEFELLVPEEVEDEQIEDWVYFETGASSCIIGDSEAMSEMMDQDFEPINPNVTVK